MRILGMKWCGCGILRHNRCQITDQITALLYREYAMAMRFANDLAQGSIPACEAISSLIRDYRWFCKLDLELPRGRLCRPVWIGQTALR